MSLPEHIANNFDKYGLILVLPIVGWLGTIVFLKDIHILSDVSMIFGLIAFIWAFVLVTELLGKKFPLKWAYPAYIGYLAILFCWGVSSLSWNKSYYNLIAASMTVVVINFIVTLLLSWFITEIKQRQN